MVQQSECHQARKIPSSTSTQKTHQDTHEIHHKVDS
jgi:hypothetical protein